MADEQKSSKDLFAGNSQHSASYAKFRPVYSEHIFEAIYDYAGTSSGKDCALDVATGTGQAARELAKRYCRVVAQDVSQEQINEALSNENGYKNIQFQQCAAESISLPDNSVDLVTIAEALHWVDQPRAFAEFARVLKPGGVLAVWGYDIPRIAGEPEADAAFQRLYNDTLGPYWDSKRQLVDNRYRDVKLPNSFVDEQRRNMEMKVENTVGGLLGIVSSWSAYHTYRAKHPNAQDPVMRFHGELKDALEFVSHSTEIDLYYPIFMILARKPNAAN